MLKFIEDWIKTLRTAALTPRPTFRSATPARAKTKKIAYSQGLRNHWQRLARQAAIDKVKAGKRTPLRDGHGAVTFVGKPRRVWLGGVSSQRGY